MLELYATICVVCERFTDECIRDREGHYWKDEVEPLTGFEPARAGLAAARPESNQVLPNDSTREDPTTLTAGGTDA